MMLVVNWAQLAGPRFQNNALPYSQKGISRNPLWSGRWGHTVVVLNDTTTKNYLSIEENSKRIKDLSPAILLMGGDDYQPNKYDNLINGKKKKIKV